MDDKEKEFIEELERVCRRKLIELESDNEYSSGYILEEGKVIYLNLYYLYDLEIISENIGNLTEPR